MRLLSIDPGLRNCGVACFENGKLSFARLVKSDKKNPMPMALADMVNALVKDVGKKFDAVVIEQPMIYPGRRGKARASDILNLTAVVGAICGEYRGCKVVTYKPFQWKGQLPKKVCEFRVKKKLSKEELKKVKLAGALSHNIWDSIGLGMYYLNITNVL